MSENFKAIIVNQTEKEFGKLDLLINNAGALSWKPIKDTEMKNYDLINNINSRASFHLSKLAIPLLQQSDNSHIINQSPPLFKSKMLKKANKFEVGDI